MSALSRDAILAVLSGLTVLGCDKTAQVQPEPEPAPPASAAASPAEPKSSAAAPVVVASPSSAPAASAGLKEVKPAAGQPAEKEKTCAPGGCAPGQCGANK